MKRYVALCIIIFLSLNVVFAKGIIITPGTRASSLGGAYVGIADDATAIYWNPAGLAQLKGAGADISTFYASPTAKSNMSLANVVQPDLTDGDFPILDVWTYAALIGTPGIPAGVEPASYKNKELETNAVLPFIAGYKNMNDITVAVGFYAVGGGGGKWDDTVNGAIFTSDQIKAKIDAKYGFMVGNLSAAKNIMPKLSLGLGFNYIYMFDSAKIEKEYIISATSLLPAGYAISMEQDATGAGFEVTAGLMYEPIAKLKTGAVFRSGATITLDGTAELVTTGAAALMPSAKTDYEQKYAYPMTYGVGLSYEPVNALTVAGSVDVINYSTMKDDIDYETESTSFSDEDTDLEWDNAVQYHLGAEYRINERLAVRSGLQTDPVASPTENLTLLNTNQYAITTLSIGLGYVLGPANIDFNYAHNFSDEPSKSNRTYEYPSDSFRLVLGYKFI